jgi:hypothetical protein
MMRLELSARPLDDCIMVTLEELPLSRRVCPCGRPRYAPELLPVLLGPIPNFRLSTRGCPLLPPPS